MTKDIDPKLKLISDYLGPKEPERLTEQFVIPEYQRRYSWTKQECDKLWQDIDAYKDSGHKVSLSSFMALHRKKHKPPSSHTTLYLSPAFSHLYRQP